MLRFFPPPFTPLMLIRYAQTGKPWVSEWVSLKEIPERVKRAVLVAEDSNFFDHIGVDFGAMYLAWFKERSDKPRGASTITMQTVKNIYLWPGRSYIRKFLEIPMALAANLVWRKERTLELYLNVIEWGEGIYGVKAAARHYFKKPLAMLTRSEAAALAVMLPNPRKMSPGELSSSAKRQMGRVLRSLQ